MFKNYFILLNSNKTNIHQFSSDGLKKNRMINEIIIKLFIIIILIFHL